ncbi:hypothetical protein PVK62_14365 [Aliivibrio sp. S3MY1]|uniref:hypothetical protein n=1 Tax=unclassified Aliivibrio TaxID=2645654 RepID=UPI002377FA4D|nr:MULTISPECIES: hypothetical protein [unclassified Aliivibrio]MDD9197007.1 hypothetical protein [Aliivibrio sp. S3MY1]MDD9198079.1 hypothetical protein [Aliivibrio sp. S2MY1]
MKTQIHHSLYRWQLISDAIVIPDDQINHAINPMKPDALIENTEFNQSINVARLTLVK